MGCRGNYHDVRSVTLLWLGPDLVIQCGAMPGMTPIQRCQMKLRDAAAVMSGNPLVISPLRKTPRQPRSSGVSPQRDRNLIVTRA